MDKSTFKKGYEPRDGWPFATPYDDGEEAVKEAPEYIREGAKRLLKNAPKTIRENAETIMKKTDKST